MSDRFFTDSSFVDEKITLSDDQAHHVANVMRAQVGDAITVFDAEGNEFQTEIIEKTKKRVTLQLISTARPERKLRQSIRIITALPKGDRQKFLIEKLVELGVESLVPLETSRSVAQFNDKVRARVEKQVIEATKQCRRSYLMKVEQPVSVDSAIDLAEGSKNGFYVAHPYCETHIATLKTQLSKLERCCWLIGPEGGFSKDEFVRAVDAGWTPVTFGDIILRIETAAIKCAVVGGLAYDPA